MLAEPSIRPGLPWSLAPKEYFPRLTMKSSRSTFITDLTQWKYKLRLDKHTFERLCLHVARLVLYLIFPANGAHC